MEDPAPSPWWVADQPSGYYAPDPRPVDSQNPTGYETYPDNRSPEHQGDTATDPRPAEYQGLPYQAPADFVRVLDLISKARSQISDIEQMISGGSSFVSASVHAPEYTPWVPDRNIVYGSDPRPTNMKGDYYVDNRSWEHSGFGYDPRNEIYHHEGYDPRPDPEDWGMETGSLQMFRDPRSPEHQTTNGIDQRTDMHRVVIDHRSPEHKQQIDQRSDEHKHETDYRTNEHRIPTDYRSEEHKFETDFRTEEHKASGKDYRTDMHRFVWDPRPAPAHLGSSVHVVEHVTGP
jgi:hypothetical protein